MTKPVKAWAVVTKRGKIELVLFSYKDAHFAAAMEQKGERVIPVLITPIKEADRG